MNEPFAHRKIGFVCDEDLSINHGKRESGRHRTKESLATELSRERAVELMARSDRRQLASSHGV